MKFNCVQASLNIVDHIGYLHSTFKFTEPFFISFMIFPGKTNDVIYVLVLYEEIEARRGGDYQLPKISVLSKNLNYVALGPNCSTAQVHSAHSVPSILFLPLYAAGTEEKIRGSLGTGGQTSG